MEQKTLDWPKDAERLDQLHSGDLVLFSGFIYTARDAAHQRLVKQLERGEPTPFEIRNSAIYYAGPSPCPPGRVSGSIGPTTSGRMDAYKEAMLKAGMKVMIGKGACMPELRVLCQTYGGVYLAATGGVAALSAGCVKAAELIAWEDLGAEAVRRLLVENMPLVVINDVYGRDYYEEVMEGHA